MVSASFPTGKGDETIESVNLLKAVGEVMNVSAFNFLLNKCTLQFLCWLEKKAFNFF